MNVRCPALSSAVFVVVPALASAVFPVYPVLAQKPVPKPALAEAATESRSRALPVRRVALYKNGVGFFEHAGSVTGNQRVTIDFTTGQLNDVLQTLTAIDLNGGRIGGAGYNSTTPLEQQLKNLPLALGQDPTEADFYQAIRGARVEVTGNGAAVTGRLLNVELRSVAPPKEDGAGAGVQKQFLTVISDTGAARTLELTSAVQVRLLDSSLHQDVSRYLQLLAENRSQGLRHLTLDANGTGTRQLRVSYISEVPIWKSTYRLLFTDGAEKQSATLQAWAVVDNTVGADWENVQLSLIAGAPQSFIQPISQPFYARRPEIDLPEEVQLTPQTHESGEGIEAPKTMGQTPAGIAGMSGIGAGSGSGVAGGVMGGIGRAYDRLNYVNESVAVAPPPPIAYEDSAAASIAPATTMNAYDDFFEYKLSEPITIRKNESAMVPILQAKVDAERVTLWTSSQPRPLRALWITNTTKATLDRGSFSIVENGSFGGEGLLDPIHAGERRLLSYAADDAVRVTTESSNDTRRLQQVIVRKGVFTSRTQEIAELTYVVHNAAAEPRTVIVEHNRRNGWELDSDPKPVETTPAIYRYRVEAKPGETIRLHVGERHTLSQTWQLAGMSEQQIDIILHTNGDSPALRQQLQPILEARRQLAAIDNGIRDRQQQIDSIANDQQRLRNNLSALKGSAEEKDLIRRYTGELNQQEDQIASLRKEQDDLKQQRSTAQANLDAKVQALESEQNF